MKARASWRRARRSSPGRRREGQDPCQPRLLRHRRARPSTSRALPLQTQHRLTPKKIFVQTARRSCSSKALVSATALPLAAAFSSDAGALAETTAHTDAASMRKAESISSRLDRSPSRSSSRRRQECLCRERQPERGRVHAPPTIRSKRNSGRGTTWLLLRAASRGPSIDDRLALQATEVREGPRFSPNQQQSVAPRALAFTYLG
jgi:hypothetical protein